MNDIRNSNASRQCGTEQIIVSIDFFFASAVNDQQSFSLLGSRQVDSWYQRMAKKRAIRSQFVSNAS